MNKILIIINLIVWFFLSGCNPTTPPTVKYFSEKGAIVLIDDTSAYIKQVFIDIYDSINVFEFNYPIDGDTLMRSEINLLEYFDLDKDFLKNKNIAFSISLGQKKNKQVFIFCNNGFKISETDSIYKIECAWW